MKIKLTQKEIKAIYEIHKTYYYKKKIGFTFKNWEKLTKLPYHNNLKKYFQLILEKNEIRGYIISVKIKIKNIGWRKIIEAGISSSSPNKIKDLIKMSKYLKKRKNNLIMEVGEDNQKISYVLKKYCQFKSFKEKDKKQATQIMEQFLQDTNFKLSKDEHNNLIINRQTKQRKNYKGYLIYWENSPKTHKNPPSLSLL